jgi:HD superfamily phosphohydrolase YqeK
MATTASSRVRPAALLDAAAIGRLPPWANVGAERVEHMRRVAALMADWSARLGLPERDRTRWTAAGFLHDALRDAPPAELRALLEPGLRDLPDRLLHGPAAAARLRADGIDDEPLLRAIAWHTLGHADFDDIGRALYIADYVEPGRTYDPGPLAVLRARMPAELAAVLRSVLCRRMEHLIAERRIIRPETAGLWNAVGAAHAA